LVYECAILIAMSDENGSGNGQNKDDKDDKNKDGDGEIIRFPSLVERERREREQREQEERWRAAYRAEMKSAGKQPFFNFDNLPLVTRFLVFAFVIIHVIRAFLLPGPVVADMIRLFAFIPGTLTGAVPFEWTALIGPFTYAFLHAGWMHLIFNTIMTLAFGVFFERIAGGRALFAFFMACSLGGALLYALMSPGSMVPVIGASGGLSGLFAAFLIFMYDQRAFPPLAQKLTRYGVWPMLGFWFLFMIVIGMLMGDVAWQAHIGGYVAGIGYVMAMKRGYLRF